MPTIFRDYSPAMIENLVGKASTWLNQEDDTPRGDILCGVYHDAWEIIVECSTDCEEYKKEHSYQETSYDKDGEVISHSPGRFFKERVTLRIKSSEMFGYQRNDPDARISIDNHITINFTPDIGLNYKFKAETTLAPKRDTSLNATGKSGKRAFVGNISGCSEQS